MVLCMLRIEEPPGMLYCRHATLQDSARRTRVTGHDRRMRPSRSLAMWLTTSSMDRSSSTYGSPLMRAWPAHTIAAAVGVI